MIEREIQEFGNRLGLDQIEASSSGVSQLDIQDIGSLYLERNEDGHELLVYLTRPVPQYDTESIRRLFEMCDYRRALPIRVSVGVYAGQAIVLTRLNEHEVSAAHLENVLRYFVDFLQQATAA